MRATTTGHPRTGAAEPRRRYRNQARWQSRRPPSATPRASFYQTDFRSLDQDLSPQQMQEWNSIYASYRSQSMLSGTVIGVDTTSFDVLNPDTKKHERQSILSLVIVEYRVKVLIPQSEIWMSGEEHPAYAIRNMVGSKVEYVIMNVDRAGEVAIASRRAALQKRRRRFLTERHREGDIVKCNVLVVGPNRCTVEVGGYDLTLTQRDLSYTAIPDLRRSYRPGQELDAKLLEAGTRNNPPRVSVKEVNPNPFDGAELRHPVGCRRQAVISGKYAGGVFCTLPDDVVCLCLYSNNHYDDEFFIGDNVMVHIIQYNYHRNQIYGRIVSKW